MFAPFILAKVALSLAPSVRRPSSVRRKFEVDTSENGGVDRFGDNSFVSCVIFESVRGTQSICKHINHQPCQPDLEFSRLTPSCSQDEGDDKEPPDDFTTGAAANIMLFPAAEPSSVYERGLSCGTFTKSPSLVVKEEGRMALLCKCPGSFPSTHINDHTTESRKWYSRNESLSI